jgi:hypothetical protein
MRTAASRVSHAAAGGGSIGSARGVDEGNDPRREADLVSASEPTQPVEAAEDDLGAHCWFAHASQRREQEDVGAARARPQHDPLA